MCEDFSFGENCTLLWREHPLNIYAWYFPIFIYPSLSIVFVGYFIWIYIKQTPDKKFLRKPSYPDLAVISTILADIFLALFFIQEGAMVSAPQMDFSFILFILGVIFIVFVIFVSQTMIRDVAETFISMGRAKGKKVEPIKRMLPSFVFLFVIYGSMASLYYLNIFGPSILIGLRVILLGAIPVCLWILYESKVGAVKLVNELTASTLGGNQNADILQMKMNLIVRLNRYNKFVPMIALLTIPAGAVCGFTRLLHHPIAWIITIQVFLPLNCLMANFGFAFFLYRKPDAPKSSTKSVAGGKSSKVYLSTAD